MIKNYFKTAWRNLWRNKLYSIITVSGLSLSMAGAILLLIWIQNAMSMDQFHTKSSVLYQLYKKASVNGYVETWEATPAAAAPALAKDHQEIRSTARMLGTNGLFKNAGNRIMATGSIVDPSFLTMFSFPLEKGNPGVALSNDHSVVITTALAAKLFPGIDPINKTIQLDDGRFVVTGVLKNLPNNTRFNFEYLLPWKRVNNAGSESWDSNQVVTYVELDPLADESVVNSKIRDDISGHSKNDSQAQLFLYSFSKTWLYGNFINGIPSGGGIGIVRLLFVVVFILLLIGAINFMNLSTARGVQRAKEVGVRKIAGAGKKTLILQFISESILLSLIAGIIALFIAELLLPAFNNLTEKQLAVDYTAMRFWIAALGFVLFTGLLAGSYPAFYLSSFKAVNVLKKTAHSRYSMLTPRKVLVVVQFIVSIVMINYSYILIKQTHFMMQRDAGFLKDDIVFHPLTNDLQMNFVVLKQELLNSGKVIAVNKTGGMITQAMTETNGLQWKGDKLANQFQLITTNADFINTNGLQLLEGRDIDVALFPADTTSCMINETALHALGTGNVIGQPLVENGTDCRIVGVVKDFVNVFPGQEIQPLMIRGSDHAGFINIRLNPGKRDHALTTVSEILKRNNPGYFTELKLAADDYAKKFKGAEVSISLVTGFTLVAVFISCLGLFGLGIFMVTTRIKEIGIRKVLGAGAVAISWLLTKDFIKLVMIAIVVGSPLAWLLMKTATQNFAYRIDVHWWIPLVTGLLAIMIALVTVSFRSVGAALANPAKSLKTE